MGSILGLIQICETFAPQAPIGKYWLSCLIDSEPKTGNCCSLAPGWEWEGCDFRLPLKS